MGVRRWWPRLVSHGYITSSVRFAPQNLASGLLQVSLQVGRVAHIDLRGAASAIGRNAIAFKPGDALNLRDIEQTLENLARLPSQTVQFQIEAADLADASVVAIAIAGDTTRTWRLSAGLDNAAPRDCGHWQTTAQAVWDAPLGLSDQVAVSLNRTTGLGAWAAESQARAETSRGGWQGAREAQGRPPATSG